MGSDQVGLKLEALKSAPQLGCWCGDHGGGSGVDVTIEFRHEV